MTAPVLDLGPRIEATPASSCVAADSEQSAEEFADVLRSSTHGKSAQRGASAKPDSRDRAEQPGELASSETADDVAGSDDHPSTDTDAQLSDEELPDKNSHAVIWGHFASQTTAAVSGGKHTGRTAETTAGVPADDRGTSRAGRHGRNQHLDGDLAGRSTQARADGQIPGTHRAGAAQEAGSDAAVAHAHTTADEKTEAASNKPAATIVPVPPAGSDTAAKTAAGGKTAANTGQGASQATPRPATPTPAAATGADRPDAGLDATLRGRSSIADSPGQARTVTPETTAQGHVINKETPRAPLPAAAPANTAAPAVEATTASMVAANNSVTPTVSATPAAAVSAAPAPTNLMQPEISAALAQLRGQADGNYQLRAAIHPAELGAVEITASIRGGNLTVLLSADTSAHQAVSQALEQLREQLADAGFTGVDVSLSNRDSQQHSESDSATADTLRGDVERETDDLVDIPQAALLGRGRGIDRFL